MTNIEREACKLAIEFLRSQVRLLSVIVESYRKDVPARMVEEVLQQALHSNGTTATGVIEMLERVSS